jgi:hypothetical protein
MSTHFIDTVNTHPTMAVAEAADDEPGQRIPGNLGTILLLAFAAGTSIIVSFSVLALFVLSIFTFAD